MKIKDCRHECPLQGWRGWAKSEETTIVRGPAGDISEGYLFTVLVGIRWPRLQLHAERRSDMLQNFPRHSRAGELASAHDELRPSAPRP